ncbi:MAG: FAD-dependent oxidoreductase [Syntrophales bacterium]|nr:FAD-dependent oxidoreductase [Syntrophales bacterium]
MKNELKALFNPLHIGPLTLKNRLVFSAMGQNVKNWAEFLSIRAKGGVGLVMVPSGMIMRDAADQIFHIHADKFIPGLAEIAQALHAHGAKVGIQIHHQGRQSHFPDTPVAPSPIPCPVTRRMPRELTRDEILNLVEEYSDGVRRARDAGFDMAEIHGAHGYLVNQFLAARSNQRRDEYGGDAVKRARFLVEIISRSRDKVESSFPICCRINAIDGIEGGLTIEDSKLTARLAEQAGASLINVSGGVYGYPITIPSLYSPPAIYAEYAAQIKEVIKIPVCVAGHIDDIQSADRMVRDGKVDLIALGRPLLTDPELPNKAMRGELHRIRPCLYCNNGCMAHLEARSLASPCTVNPWVERAVLTDCAAAEIVKKVVIVGGGLAGLEAARIASLRGHKVNLYEKENNLGGQWILAAVPPSKDSFLRYLKWLISEVELAGVEIRLNRTFAVHDLRAEDPDTVILATGAFPAIPPVPGIENATTAWKVLQGKAQVGANVLIVGGNATGLEVAHLLAVQGKRVTVIEMTARFGADMPPTVRWHLRKLLDEHGVRLMPLVKLKEIGPDNDVSVEAKDGEETWSEFSDVILATGVRSRNELKASLESVARELYVIGDAKQPRSGLEAIAEGAEVGLLI